VGDRVVAPLVIAQAMAVASRSTRVAAPWTWKNPTIDIGERMFSARSTMMFRTS
jgi:hypothetical protein